MIDYIHIHRFKALKEVCVPMRALTVLAGLNGTGKSSCIQTLLLLRQSFLEETLPKRGLLLRGSLLNLGTGKDVFHQFSKDENISIKISSGGFLTSWVFDVDMESDLLKAHSNDKPPKGSPAYKAPPFSDNFWYISSERISPQTSYPNSYHPTGQSGPLGMGGEFTIDYLARKQIRPIGIADAKHKSLSPKATDLLSNTRAWLSEISPGVTLTPQRFTEIDRSIINFDYKSDKNIFSHKLRPVNVGFGLTYILPVIVSLLSAKPGDLLIIENPESHVHPKGQMQIGILCSIVAAAGVQIIIETHSDHFLNGVRIAAKRTLIAASDTSIVYFERDPNDPNHSTEIKMPALDKDGKLDSWPQGFFDQWEEALFELI